MRGILTLLIILVMWASCKPAAIFQIECNSASLDASYVVDITYGPRMKNPSIEQAKLNAVDGVLFRGLTGRDCVTQKPMIALGKSEVAGNQLINRIYGKSRSYNYYVTSISQLESTVINENGKITPRYRYRVNINKELLRKDLIKAGLVKSLQSGF